MVTTKVVKDDDDPFYYHTLTARVRFDPEFIGPQIAAWQAEYSQGKITRTYDQFFAQINNYPKPDRPSHMCRIQSDYQTFIDGFYICTLIIVTGSDENSEILTAIREARHAYLYRIPRRPYIAECFLEG
ncbi:hypothetical protein [Aquirhabdus parva]|uniref:Uncharacterized protein n=1 Tax=Aquirhabdus parva TaxID=2283318 RepID=A0A345P949_9GAMM|nr:hypothetical protein [Aquirhabdus parva]AXI03808.1 hypothetical protein HYN46_13775 [Aquirhabdus parva]